MAVKGTHRRVVSLLSNCGFRLQRLVTDKWQSLSLAFAFLVPLIKLVMLVEGRRKNRVPTQNSSTLLFGRKLIVVAEKLGQGREGDY
jgi:hypothetical protein